ncbi:hypothetical protein KCU95_g123, partial [Aureobasidium melanogenum]
LRIRCFVSVETLSAPTSAAASAAALIGIRLVVDFGWFGYRVSKDSLAMERRSVAVWLSVSTGDSGSSLSGTRKSLEDSTPCRSSDRASLHARHRLCRSRYPRRTSRISTGKDLVGVVVWKAPVAFWIDFIWSHLLLYFLLVYRPLIFTQQVFFRARTGVVGDRVVVAGVIFGPG